MTHDELEFQISQYLDGTLAGADSAALEDRLAQDVALRALLEEHRAVTALLREAPLPAIQWDRLAETISTAVDEADAPAAARMRIFPLRLPRVFAVAASLLLVLGIAALVNHQRAPTHKVNPEAVATIDVQGPTSEKASGPVVTEVAIGPGDELKDESAISAYSDDIASRPSRVIVAGDFPAEQSNNAGPF